MRRRRVILDTDIGTDVDDAFAVALAAVSKEIDVAAVTVVHGDVDLRARIARKLLNLAGRDDIPVSKGLSEPLTPGMEYNMHGHEGKGILTPSDKNLKIHEKPAVDLIIDDVLSSGEETTVITIGPVTNLAVAIKKEPKIKRRIEDYIFMGGALNPPIIKGKPLSPRFETNLNSDPLASKIVLQSGIPTTMVPMDVTWQVLIGFPHLEKLRRACTPLTDALAGMLEIWLSEIRGIGEDIFGCMDMTAMHDPLTVSLAIEDRFLKLEEMHIDPQIIEGIFRTVPKPNLKPNMKVATDVDASGFINFLVERLTRH
jgi:purine nucleosidase